jgi:hypothetical protein
MKNIDAAANEVLAIICLIFFYSYFLSFKIYSKPYELWENLGSKKDYQRLKEDRCEFLWKVNLVRAID